MLTRRGEFLYGRDHPAGRTWAFDGGTVRITPGLHRRVPLLRQTYGEIAVPPPASGHHDVLLRRLRELGRLHRDGVLTDEEFAMTKAAVLRTF
ncbi:hypothetical protein SAMN06272771_4832 [Streptomyces sp. Ag82_O1-12]|uniref:hypothetical protein n=1 Tax=Streptomyces sp. Ag82_G6-1 TaxID=1938853 RepID=UPI000BC3785D|nr:hypothetical protein SAMN06272771_4832 [Streptomyces sp. Ag82_O1-12]SOD47419.1 hypothetical protein SAMN06272727_4833 [Streptomyces sp. Ag82_G6-1]